MKLRRGNFNRTPVKLLGAVAMVCALGLGGSVRSVHAGMRSIALLAPGSPGDTTADGVLGQANFAQNGDDFRDGRGVDNTFVPQPSGDVAIDKSVSPNRVYVVDPGNNRVLGWSNVASFASHASADIVLGQPDLFSGDCNQNSNSAAVPSAATLCHPSSVAVDGAGRVYVADSGNNRVLLYIAPFTPPFTSVKTAADVFGQAGSFVTKDCDVPYFSTTAVSLCNPSGVAVDAAGNLYVSDQNDNRVLEYNTPQANTAVAGSGDTTADKVFGQGNNFTTKICNLGGVTLNSLCKPRGVAVDSAGNVYVADHDNSRVLIYLIPLTTNTTADKVLGQSNAVNTGTCNKGGITANSLCRPLDVAIDSANNAYVADGDNNRVLEYNTPLTVTAVPGSGNTTADKVFGQNGSFASNLANLGGISAKSLSEPSGVAVDPSNNLYVADANNNRELKYNTPLTTDTIADGVLSQALFTTNAANEIDQFGIDTGFNNGAVAIDQSVSPNRVYVADIANNRVLAWSNVSAFATHAGANLVFGQPNVFTNAANLGVVSASAKSLNGPDGVAVDKAGNLYVADTNNNRVLEYNTPFTVTAVPGSGDTTADKVFGQNDLFTPHACNAVTVNALCGPLGVAIDSAGNVYISDSMNNRVLEYNTPLTTNRSADKVFGQPNFSFNSPNQGLSNPTSATLSNPWGVALDTANHLYIADNANNRVLEYNTPLISAAPGKLFGQVNFVSGSPNGGGASPSASTLSAPQGLAVDSANNLYVVDKSNNRALKYNTPLTTDVKADKVFGQYNLFDQSGFNQIPSPNTLAVPDGVAVDSSKNLYVVDGENFRVLQYLAP